MEVSSKKAVAIYTTPTCTYCRQAKHFFDDHQIAYTERNVAEDQQLAQEMIQKSGQMGVPVIVVTSGEGKHVKEDVIVGFDQQKLEHALGIT